MVPTLAGVVLLIFFLFKLFGGDPAQILAGQIASQEQIDAIRRELGLDQPWYVQLGIFVKEILTFDWGKSWITREQVSHIFLSRLPATLTITIPILLLEAALAIPTAMLVAYYRGTLLDRTVIAICVSAMSISFLVYIIVGQYLFGFQLGWFPVQGWSDSFWKNLVTYAPLPILLAALVGLAPQTRLYRSFFLDETKSDYVRTARAKGLSEPAILRKHVLRRRTDLLRGPRADLAAADLLHADQGPADLPARLRARMPERSQPEEEHHACRHAADPRQGGAPADLDVDIQRRAERGSPPRTDGAGLPRQLRPRRRRPHVQLRRRARRGSGRDPGAGARGCRAGEADRKARAREPAPVAPALIQRPMSTNAGSVMLAIGTLRQIPCVPI